MNPLHLGIVWLLFVCFNATTTKIIIIIKIHGKKGWQITAK